MTQRKWQWVIRSVEVHLSVVENTVGKYILEKYSLKNTVWKMTIGNQTWWSAYKCVEKVQLDIYILENTVLKCKFEKYSSETDNEQSDLVKCIWEWWLQGKPASFISIQLQFQWTVWHWNHSHIRKRTITAILCIGGILYLLVKYFCSMIIHVFAYLLLLLTIS